MNRMYLVPANSKKSLLILGIFNSFDLTLFISGAVATCIFLLFVPLTSVGVIMFVLAPLVVTAILVFPIPNYHNVLQLIINVFNFFTKSQRYYWKGWCIRDGIEDTNNSK